MKMTLVCAWACFVMPASASAAQLSGTFGGTVMSGGEYLIYAEKESVFNSWVGREIVGNFSGYSLEGHVYTSMTFSIVGGDGGFVNGTTNPNQISSYADYSFSRNSASINAYEYLGFYNAWQSGGVSISRPSENMPFSSGGGYYQSVFPYAAGTSIEQRLDFSFSVESGIFRAIVPEPSTWAMLIFGFGLCGGVARKRTSHAAFA